MLANALTTARLVLAAAFAVAVYALTPLQAPSLATMLLLVALVLLEEATDVFDGILARRYGSVGQIGGLYDPLSDSLSRLTIYFAIALNGWITLAVPLVMTLRDIIVAYVRVILAIDGAKTSARISGKIKAIIQGGAMPVVILLPFAAAIWPKAPIAWVRPACAWILVAVTLWSLADYIASALPSLRRLSASAASREKSAA